MQALQTVFSRVALLTVVVLIGLISLIGLAQPVLADPPSQSLSAEEKLERAYDYYDQDAGFREDLDQQEATESYDANKRPIKRVKSVEGKDVPRTSLVETAVSKAKQLGDAIKGRD
jgi:hypothetical protein